MIAARRLILLVALAALAVVPLRAFGVVGEAAPAGLSVSASLYGCGIGDSSILCRIDTSFGGVPGADHYTATVTRADGTVQDAGTVGSGEGGGSATIYVPYVGAGVYSVTVSAWGVEDDLAEGEPELLERDTDEAEGEGGGDRNGGDGEASGDEPATDPEAGEPAEAAPGGGSEPSATPETEIDAPPSDSPPECAAEEPEGAEPQPPPAEEPAEEPAESRTDLLSEPAAAEAAPAPEPGTCGDATTTAAAAPPAE